MAARQLLLAMTSALLVLMALLPAPAAAQRRVNTVGGSGVMCGTTRCLVGVPCISGKCRCPSGHGSGSFVCAQSNTELCYFNNDPILHSFDGSHVEIPLVNKVLITHIEAKPHSDDAPSHQLTGECDVRVFAWGHRRLGKLFIKGLEVKATVIKGWKVYNHAVRIQAGVNSQGEHEFVEEGNANFMGNPPYGRPVKTRVAGGADIRTTYDHENNFAKVIVGGCGVEAGIRGVDFTGEIDFHEQEPGIYVSVDKKVAPTYLSQEHTMCASPVGLGQTLHEQQESLESRVGRPVSPHTMMMMKALNSDSFQDFPGAAKILWSLAETATECDTVSEVHAIENCTFIFDNVHFHRCFDKEDNDAKALALLNNCIWSICDLNESMCKIVQHEIEKSECPTAHPIYGSIMTHSCSFDKSSRSNDK